jgi:hypothetical protein
MSMPFVVSPSNHERPFDRLRVNGISPPSPRQRRVGVALGDPQETFEDWREVRG